MVFLQKLAIRLDQLRAVFCQILFDLSSQRIRLWALLCLLGSLSICLLDLVIANILLAILKMLGVELESKASIFNEMLMSSTFAPVFIAFLLVGLIRAVSQFFVGQSATVIVDGVVNRLRLALGYLVLMNPAKTLDEKLDVLHWSSSVFSPVGFSMLHLTYSVAYLLQSIVMVIMVVYFAPIEAAIGMVGILCIGIFVFLANSFARERMSMLPSENERFTDILRKLNENKFLIKNLHQEGHEWHVFSNRANKVYRESCKSTEIINVASSATPFLGVVLLTGILYVSMNFLETPNGDLLVFFFLFVRFIQSIGLTSDALSKSFHKTYFILDVLKLVSPVPKSFLANIENQKIDGAKLYRRSRERNIDPPSIECRSVSYCYPNNTVKTPPTSFRIEAGQVAAIVGPSGSGKSTLLSLILGLRQPTEGVVTIDGAVIDGPLYAKPLSIGYCGPNPYIFEGTLLENISYGLQEEPSVDSVKKALSKVGLIDVVDELENGLHTELGNRRRGLSTGQLQRLAIGRVFLNPAALIILDEFTANIDSEAEKLIVDNLHVLKGRSTIVVVTHKLEALRIADVVVDMGVADETGGARLVSREI